MGQEKVDWRQPASQERREIGGLDLPTDKIPEFIKFLSNQGLHENTHIIPGHEATVYFLTRDAHPLPFRLRFRLYGLQEKRIENFSLEKKDVGVLEIKHKPQKYPFRIESKQRTTCSAGAVARIIQFPDAAKVILTLDKQPLTIPAMYPHGQLSPEALQQISSTLGTNGEIIPSLVITRSRAHFILPGQPIDALRVTIDEEIGYLGYDYNSPQDLFEQPQYLGSSENNRVEIKIVDPDQNDLGQEILEYLQLIGQRPAVRRKGFQRYFRYFTGVPGENSIQPIFKTHELPGREIEGKMTITDETSTQELALLIYEVFKSSTVDNFQIHPGLNHMRESKTHAIRYGKKDTNSFEELFVITIYPDGRVAGIKRKVKTIGTHGSANNILDKTEERQDIPFPEWTLHAEECVISEEAERLSIDHTEIIRVGESDRHKIRVYVQNEETHRSYVISVEENKSGKKKVLKQIEIEYGIRAGIHTQYSGEFMITGIIEDIEKIQEVILNLCKENNIEITPEALTKFDWLTQT